MVIPLILLIVSVLVYYFTSPSGNTPYNHFTLLADAFLKGKLYIEGNYPWLEKVPLDAHRFYVANPPMPAILALPFVELFGKNFPQQYIAHILAAFTVVVWFYISKNLTKSNTKAIFISLLVGFGNIFWFLASVGSVWYLGQVSAMFFISLSLYFLLSKNYLFLSGMFFGAAYLSRINLAVAIIFFMYFAYQAKKLKGFFHFILGVTPFILTNFIYNYLRFGVIWDKGYILIPGLWDEPWYSKGLVNYHYILDHVKILFTSLPIFKNTWPFLFPTWFGLAIWFTTPAFIYSLLAKVKSKLTVVSWLTISLIAFGVFMHGSTGFAQFGYRFAVDFYPFLFLLVCIYVKEKNLKWHHWTLLIFSILINLWGVLWINKFDWVSP